VEVCRVVPRDSAGHHSQDLRRTDIEDRQVSEQFVGSRISIAFLAPQIVVSICAGTQSEGLTAEALVKRIEIPASWSEQAEQLQPGDSFDL